MTDPSSSSNSSSSSSSNSNTTDAKSPQDDSTTTSSTTTTTTTMTEQAEEASSMPSASVTIPAFTSKNRSKYANLGAADAAQPHKFWDTQPVPKLSTDPTVEASAFGEGNIEGLKRVEDVPVEPTKLPEGFEWFNPDVKDPEMLEQVYLLLAENYVEDTDSMFRFNYPKDFLYWALTPPGWYADWHIGVRVKKTGKIVGFISGIPSTIQVRGSPVRMTEINFLCAHKQIRSKRLAPVLIKELTRRVHLQNIWHAVYTAGIVLPRPVVQCQYWHRTLNPAKLIAIGFSRIPPQFEKFHRPMEATKRHFALPDKPQIPGLRPMVEQDLPQVTKLLQSYLAKFALAPVFEEEDVRHWILPKPDVVTTYVVENKQRQVTDLFSFYCLPSTIIGNQKYDRLKVAYSFYNVTTQVELKELMFDALIVAKQQDFDVFNALDIMQNKAFLRELKFGIGDGHLQYYLYNYRTKDMQPEEIGLVML